MTSSFADNPVARLRAFVDKAKKIDQNVSMKTGWAKLCEHKENDFVSILADIADFSIMVKNARTVVESLEGFDHALFLRPIQTFEAIVQGINLNERWTSILNPLNENMIYSLDMVCNVVAKFTSLHPIDEKVRTDLLDNVNALIKEVLESDYPADLKSFMMEQLERLRNGIVNYTLFGETRLREAVEKAAGSFMLNGQLLGSYLDKPILKKIVLIIKSVANVVTIYKDGKLLGEGIKLLLGSGN